tara:strand:- start:1436 stop:1687 length:252 start_codon:yes stop_codon:yes gene_type:complete
MNFLEDLEELNTVMHNAYLVVTKKKTLDTLYKDLDVSEKEYFTLPFNFNDPNSVLDMLIDHYSDMEDYKKCAELINMRNVQEH